MSELGAGRRRILVRLITLHARLDLASTIFYLHIFKRILSEEYRDAPRRGQTAGQGVLRSSKSSTIGGFGTSIRLPRRKEHGEHRASAGIVLVGHLASVGQDQGAYQDQAKAEPGRCIDLASPLESPEQTPAG